MKLSRVRNLVRPVISLSNEYRVRSLVHAALPHGPPAVRRGYHFCNWKTGSQWVRLVLSDPRLHARTGLPARLHHNGLGEDPVMVTRQYPMVERYLATPLFAGAETLTALDAKPDDRAIFVTRHPRDLLVSFYFTNRENHPLNADVAARRRELERLDVEQGLLRTLDHGFDDMIRIGDSWADGSTSHPCPTMTVRYEDLSGDKAIHVWTRMLQHLTGTTLPASLVPSLLQTYTAETMGGTRDTKLRDRSTSGWEHHVTDLVDEVFHDRYGDVERRWGYETAHTPAGNHR